MAIVPAEMVTLRTQSICRYSEITDCDLPPIESYWWACYVSLARTATYEDCLLSCRSVRRWGDPRSVEATAVVRVVKMGCGDSVT